MLRFPLLQMQQRHMVVSQGILHHLQLTQDSNLVMVSSPYNMGSRWDMTNSQVMVNLRLMVSSLLMASPKLMASLNFTVNNP